MANDAHTAPGWAAIHAHRAGAHRTKHATLDPRPCATSNVIGVRLKEGRRVSDAVVRQEEGVVTPGWPQHPLPYYGSMLPSVLLVCCYCAASVLLVCC